MPGRPDPIRRGRDRLGRHVAPDSPEAVPDVPEQALPPRQALDLAQALLTEGRAFAAHEVLEASWKAAPAHERAMWQALAQLCVGVTHLQRGNVVGAARLLRRGAAGLGSDLPYGVDPQLARDAVRLAEQVETAPGGGAVPTLRLRARAPS